MGGSEEGAGGGRGRTGALHHPPPAGVRWPSPSQSFWQALNNSKLHFSSGSGQQPLGARALASVLLPPCLGELRAHASRSRLRVLMQPRVGVRLAHHLPPFCRAATGAGGLNLLRSHRAEPVLMSPYWDLQRQECHGPCPSSFSWRPPSSSFHPAPLTQPQGPVQCWQLNLVGSDPPPG